jgi:serine/threonine-protein kinase HipA
MGGPGGDPLKKSRIDFLIRSPYLPNIHSRFGDGPGGCRRQSGSTQEDFRQEFGIPSDRKYEEDSGPSLARIAGLLQDVANSGAAETFLRALTLNVAIGNYDAHAKNFSLPHTESDGLRLAPMSTVSDAIRTV